MMVLPVQQSRNPYPNHHRPQVSNYPQLPNQRLNAPTSRNNIKSLFQNQSTGELVNKGVGGLSSVLNNVQKVLHVVQSTAPIVQEYGPMVKNIPAMYRMMKAFKEADSSDDSVEKEKTDTDEIKNEHATSNIKSSETKNDNGLSTPKLFV